MNLTTIIQLLQNKVSVLQTARGQAYSIGDMNQLNAIDAELLETQNTITQLATLANISKAAASVNASLTDVAASGIDALQNPDPVVQGPSASAIFNGYDISAYATDPQYATKIQTILTSLPTFTVVGDIDSYIQSTVPGSSVTGAMVFASAQQYGVDIPLMMAIMENDSDFGTLGIGATTFNPGNIGNTGTSTQTYPSWADGVAAVANWLNNHRVVTPTTAPTTTDTTNATTTDATSTAATITPTTQVTAATSTATFIIPTINATTTPIFTPTNNNASTTPTTASTTLTTNTTTSTSTTTPSTATTTDPTSGGGSGTATTTLDFDPGNQGGETTATSTGTSTGATGGTATSTDPTVGGGTATTTLDFDPGNLGGGTAATSTGTSTSATGGGGIATSTAATSTNPTSGGASSGPVTATTTPPVFSTTTPSSGFTDPATVAPVTASSTPSTASTTQAIRKLHVKSQNA